MYRTRGMTDKTSLPRRLRMQWRHIVERTARLNSSPLQRLSANSTPPRYHTEGLEKVKFKPDLLVPIESVSGKKYILQQRLQYSQTYTSACCALRECCSHPLTKAICLPTLVRVYGPMLYEVLPTISHSRGGVNRQ